MIKYALAIIVLFVSFSEGIFTQVQTYPEKCIYAEQAPFSNYKHFNASFADCQNRCQYDDNCNFFQNFANSCVISTNMELTDNFNKSKLYFSRNTTTWKKSSAPIRYYSQLCNVFFGKKQCNLNANCKWNKGFAGYNREVASIQNNFCGRVKCLS